MNQTGLLLTSIATGFFFCAWPLRMNQSGLPGAGALMAYAAVTMVAAVVALWVSPGAWSSLRGPALSIGLQAGVLNVAGVVLFTAMLAQASRADAPRLILVVVMTQTALNGAWAAYQAGSVEPRLLAGLATAVATVWFMR